MEKREQCGRASVHVGKGKAKLTSADLNDEDEDDWDFNIGFDDGGASQGVQSTGVGCSLSYSAVREQGFGPAGTVPEGDGSAFHNQ